MGPCFGLGEAELGATLDHDHLVIDVVPDHLGDVEGVRHPVDQGNHVDAEGLLELGELEELIEHHLGNGVALEFDHQASAVAVRLVAQIGDTGEFLVAHQVSDLLHDPIADT